MNIADIRRLKEYAQKHAIKPKVGSDGVLAYVADRKGLRAPRDGEVAYDPIEDKMVTY